MPDFKYILFDLDGTITNSAPGITNSVKYALNKLNKQVPPYDTLLKFIGPPLIEGFCEITDLDPETAATAVKYYREYYPEKGIFECTVYDGITKLLSCLVADGKQLILATSKPEVYAKKITAHFGLDAYFGFIFGAAMDKTRSTKEQVIEYALKSAGITDISKAVMIGDRMHDITGAKKNGIKSIGVLYGFGSKEELTNASADYIAAAPKEIKTLLTG